MGQEFTLRVQKNSQDPVRILDEQARPLAYRRIEARISGVLGETIGAHLPEELMQGLAAVLLRQRDY